MNKKKRALALGMAATQLAAMSSIVAPLTSVTAFATPAVASQVSPQNITITKDGSTAITFETDEFNAADTVVATFDLPSLTGNKKYSSVQVDGTDVSPDSNGKYTYTITLAAGDIDSSKHITEANMQAKVTNVTALELSPLTCADFSVDLSSGTNAVKRSEVTAADNANIIAAVKAKVAETLTGVDAGDYSVEVHSTANAIDTAPTATAKITLTTDGETRYYLADDATELTPAVTIDAWATETTELTETATDSNEVTLSGAKPETANAYDFTNDKSSLLTKAIAAINTANTNANAEEADFDANNAEYTLTSVDTPSVTVALKLSDSGKASFTVANGDTITVTFSNVKFTEATKTEVTAEAVADVSKLGVTVDEATEAKVTTALTGDVLKTLITVTVPDGQGGTDDFTDYAIALADSTPVTLTDNNAKATVKIKLTLNDKNSHSFKDDNDGDGVIEITVTDVPVTVEAKTPEAGVTVTDNSGSNAAVTVMASKKTGDDTYAAAENVAVANSKVTNDDVLILVVDPADNYEVDTDNLPGGFAALADSDLTKYGITKDNDKFYYSMTVSDVKFEPDGTTVNNIKVEITADIVKAIPATVIKAALTSTANLEVEVTAGATDKDTIDAIKAAVVDACNKATAADLVKLQDATDNSEITDLSGKFKIKTVTADDVTVTKNGTTFETSVKLTVELNSGAGNYEFDTDADKVDLTVDVTVNEAIAKLDITGFEVAVKDGAAQTWTDDGKLRIAFGKFGDIVADDVAADLEITKLTGTINDNTTAADLTEAQIKEVAAKYQLTVTPDSAAGKLTVKVAQAAVSDANFTVSAGLTAQDIEIVEEITLDYDTILASADRNYQVADLTDVLTDKTKKVVEDAITAYLDKSNGPGKDYADIITLTAGTAAKDTNGYKVTVTAALKDTSGKYVIADASETNDYIIEVKKMKVTGDALELDTVDPDVGELNSTTLTLAKNKKSYTGENTIDKVVEKLVKTPTFNTDSVTLTAKTHYELTVTKDSDTQVTVALTAVDNEMVDLTEPSDLVLTIAYTKEQVEDPAKLSTYVDGTIELPINADDARIKEALKDAVDLKGLADMTEGTDYTVTVDKTALTGGTADSEYDVKLTYALVDTDNYVFKTDADNSAEVTIKVTAKAKLSTLKPEFTAKTIYIDEATKAKVEAALADYKPSFSAADASGNTISPAPTLEKGTDYDLVVAYTDGDAAASVTIKLSTTQEATYVLDSSATPGAVTVKVVVAKPADVTTAVALTENQPDADDKILAEVEALMTKLGLTKTTDYTMSLKTPPVTTDVTTTDKTAVVAVTLTGTQRVFEVGQAGDPDADRYKNSCDVNVAYSVSKAVTSHSVNIDSDSSTIVSVDKPTAAVGDTVTVTVGTVPDGKEIDKITYTTTTGGTETEIELTDGKYTFTMPDDDITIKVTLKNKTAASTYTVTVNPTTNGTVTADKPTAKEGDTVTLTITPSSSRYAVNKVTVKDASGKKITVSGSGNTRTFKMPAGNVTVDVTFRSTGSSSGGSSSGGSSSGGSHSGGSSGSTTTPSDKINDATEGSSVSIPSGTTGLLSSALDDAAKKDLTLSVPVDSTFEWTFKPSEMEDTNSMVYLKVESSTVSESQVSTIKGTAPTQTIAFDTTKTRNLGKSATLTVRTSARPTAAAPQFANLYKVNSNGTLVFVAAAPIGADGKAVVPVTESAKYAVVVANETKQLGDLNNDCKLDVTDVLGTIKAYFSNASAASNWKANVFEDNSLNVYDVLQLIKLYLNS